MRELSIETDFASSIIYRELMKEGCKKSDERYWQNRERTIRQTLTEYSYPLNHFRMFRWESAFTAGFAVNNYISKTKLYGFYNEPLDADKYIYVVDDVFVICLLIEGSIPLARIGARDHHFEESGVDIISTKRTIRSDDIEELSQTKERVFSIHDDGHLFEINHETPLSLLANLQQWGRFYDTEVPLISSRDMRYADRRRESARNRLDRYDAHPDLNLGIINRKHVEDGTLDRVLRDNDDNDDIPF